MFALGDMVTVRGQQLHGVAPVAMQQGRHAARSIARGSRGPFRYRDKGELATIGRSRAVGVVKGVRVSGFLAWALWLGIHIAYLVGVPEPAARPDPLDVRVLHARPRRARDPPQLEVSPSAPRHRAHGRGVRDGCQPSAPRHPGDAERL